jgi:hypothetical protein
MPRIVPLALRYALTAVLMAALAACGSSGASPAPATTAEASVGVATPEATPSPEPTPTPEPTVDAAAFGEQYVELATEVGEQQCPLGAILDEAAPDDAAAWQEAMTGFAEVWDGYADDLEELTPPDAVATDYATLIAGARTMSAAAEEVATGPADIDAIFATFEASYAPARDEVAAAGTAIRAALDLPPRPEDPCG